MVEFKDVNSMVQTFIYIAIFIAIALFVVGYLSGTLVSLAQTSNITLPAGVTTALNQISNTVSNMGGMVISVIGIVIVIVLLLLILKVFKEKYTGM